MTIKLLPTERLKVRLFHSRGPTFAQLPKRKYEIDNHFNHKTEVPSSTNLQRSKYIKIDDEIDNFDGSEVIELRLAYCKASVVE